MKNSLVYTLLSGLFGLVIYSFILDYSTPEQYITTNIYDGYVENDFWCSKHSTRFKDTKTKKTIILDHSKYISGKYRLVNGDHIHIEQIVTKRIDYHYNYKLKINDKTINTNFYSVRIYDIIN